MNILEHKSKEVHGGCTFQTPYEFLIFIYEVFTVKFSEIKTHTFCSISIRALLLNAGVSAYPLRLRATRILVDLMNEPSGSKSGASTFSGFMSDVCLSASLYGEW